MSTLDLLHAHLSGTATPDDIDVLDAALANDPALAREFAEAARVEAQLTAHFATDRAVLPLVTELQGHARTSPAPLGPAKGGQRLPTAVSAPLRLQPVLAPPVAYPQAGRGQAGSADPPSSPAPTHVNGGQWLPTAASAPLRLQPDLLSQAQPVPDVRHGRNRIRAAAAILLALGLMAATIGWLNHRHEISSSGSYGAPTPRQGALPPDGEARGFPKPPSFARHGETPEMAALRRRLESYYLTDLGLEQAVPLSQAVQRLLSRARELNHLRRPIIDNLSVVAPDDKAAVDASQVFVRLPQKSLTLMDALRLVAAQAGGDILLGPPGTISFQLLPERNSRKIVSRTLRVRPDFLSSRTDATPTPTIAQSAMDLELQTRKEIGDFKSRLELIKDKQGEELVAAAANLGIQDPKSAAIYASYLADQTKLKQIEELGAGPIHPDILALKAGLDEQKKQLAEGAKSIRNALETKLANANAVLANMEKIMEETRQQESSPSAIAEQGKAHLTSAAPNVVARKALEDFGISFPENTGAVFNPATSSLTVTQTEAALRQIEAFVAVESSRFTTMISAETKVFEFAEGHALENRLMDSASFREWLAEQKGAEGVSLLTAPQITTRSGQNCRVEVIRERLRENEGLPDWQGTRIDIHPVLEGEVVRLTGSAEVRRPHDAPPGRLLGDPSTPTTDLVSTAVDIEAIIPPGQTALFSLSEHANGPHLLGAITLHLMDPSGQSVGGDGAGESK